MTTSQRTCCRAGQHCDGRLTDLFAAQADRTPEATAVVCGDFSWSYRELEERANQVAHSLREAGVEHGALVGLSVQRSLEGLAGLWGVLKCGAAYVPLDPHHPRVRLARILSDARVPVILTEERWLGSLPGNDALCVCLDRIEAPLKPVSSAPLSGRGGAAEDLAYVLYTSGSTGQPKGVMVEHHALVHHSVNFAERFALNAGDRVLQFAPWSFDVSAEEIFPTLLSGATLVLRPDDLAEAVTPFNAFIDRAGLTVVNLPTPYWGEWMRQLEEDGQALPESLRLVVVGSETVTAEQYARWQRLNRGGVRWCNAYGVTEATVTSTMFEPASGESLPIVPIGRALRGVEVYVVDGEGRRAPVGESGELLLGGREVARGYLNQPELTAQKFVEDWLGANPGGRLVRTGDLARWRADGNLELLGRIDDQVKIRGFRIELGEIEAALRKHEDVREVVVLARRGGPEEEKRLVAYVEFRDEPAPADGELRQFLERAVPAYMLPAAFVCLPRLPRLVNGKIDRQALPEPGTVPVRRGGSDAPGDRVPMAGEEQRLAEVWERVLGVSRVGRDDSFYELGGNSLLAMRLCTELERLTRHPVPVGLLLQYPTIRQMVAQLKSAEETTRPSRLVPLQPHGTRPPLFLVHGAGGGMLWGYANLVQHLDPDQPVYCFTSRGLEGEEEFPTIEEIAASYVAALRAFQPTGPYQLGGYCFGGEVAFAMAQQLWAEGETVKSLILFNAMAPNSQFEKPRWTPLGAARFVGNGCRWLHYFRQWTATQRQEWIRRKLPWIERFWPLGGRRTAGTGEAWKDSGKHPSAVVDPQQRLWDSHLAASARYHPQSYPGHITLFRTRIYPVFCSFDPSFGWREFAPGGVAVKIISGAHESILDEPHVRQLAKELEASLRPNRDQPLPAGVQLIQSLWMVLPWGSAI
jgi:amino acid adenylation domain-containing protein